MKSFFVTIFFLVLITSARAQKSTSYYYHEIESIGLDTCSNRQSLVKQSYIKKSNRKLTIPITGKASRIFKDDVSNTTFRQFEYLGDVPNTRLSIIKQIDYNNERYYFINALTNDIDTVIGKPVFSENYKNFACIDNPATDERQKIQVGEIKDGSVKTKGLLESKPNTLFDVITCLCKNSVFMKDSTGKYWQLKFGIEND